MDRYNTEGENIKYKVGDTIRILPTLKAESDINRVGVVSTMVTYAGRLATITRVMPIEGLDKWVYKLDIDCGAWSWTSRMFVPSSATLSKRERNRSITF